MKRLILLRHAKSDWGNEQLKDIDRHLNERGAEDAYRMARWFVLTKTIPTLLLSSTATRALSTALIFSREMDLDLAKFKMEEKIYEAKAGELCDIIAGVASSCEELMLVGHNPGFTDLVNLLSEELFFDNLPTCGMVALKCEAKSWQQVVGGKWPVDYYQFPKDYKNQ